VPARQKVDLPPDETPEEFDGNRLQCDNVLPGRSRATIINGPREVHGARNFGPRRDPIPLAPLEPLAVTLLPSRSARRIIACGVAAACALAGSLAVRANLWGYVDSDGVAHFAPEQLDHRYQLFFKGGSTLDPPDAGQRAETASNEAFRRGAIYQRALNHPNLKRLLPLIERYARSQGIDPALVRAVIAVESGFDPAAVSPKGALGLMQLLPETAARYGVVDDPKRSAAQKLLDPAINLRAGTRYLHDLIVQFADNVSLALAAYNAGEEAVLQYGMRIPPFAETQEFVRLVEQFYRLFRPEPPAPPKGLRLKLPDKRAAAATAHDAAATLQGAPPTSVTGAQPSR
jgi:soluble lytic murein transglycosylase-like protein